MADQRVQLPIKIVDPTTSSQEAGVTASGEVKVLDSNSANALTALQLIDDAVFTDDAAFTPATSKGLAIGAEVDNTGTDSVDEGDFGVLRMSTNRLLYVAVRDNAGNERGLNVDASGNIGVTDAGGNISIDDGGNIITVDGSVTVSATDLDVRDLTQASDNVRIYANTAKDGSGTAYIPLVDTDGHVQVDVLTGGGVDTPTNPARTALTSSALAAGSSANLDSADLPSKYAWQIDITSSVSWKAVVSLNDNGSLTTITTLFGRGGEVVVWKPPHRAFAQAPAAGTGTQGWRVAMTNLDTSEAADVYATIHYADN